MIALYVSLAANVVLLLAALAQRHRARTAAVARCATCPFVTGLAAAGARIPVPVYVEPKTAILTRAY